MGSSFSKSEIKDQDEHHDEMDQEEEESISQQIANLPHQDVTQDLNLNNVPVNEVLSINGIPYVPLKIAHEIMRRNSTQEEEEEDHYHHELRDDQESIEESSQDSNLRAIRNGDEDSNLDQDEDSESTQQVAIRAGEEESNQDELDDDQDSNLLAIKNGDNNLDQSEDDSNQASSQESTQQVAITDAKDEEGSQDDEDNNTGKDERDKKDEETDSGTEGSLSQFEGLDQDYDQQTTSRKRRLSSDTYVVSTRSTTDNDLAQDNDFEGDDVDGDNNQDCENDQVDDNPRRKKFKPVIFAPSRPITRRLTSGITTRSRTGSLKPPVVKVSPEVPPKVKRATPNRVKSTPRTTPSRVRKISPKVSNSSPKVTKVTPKVAEILPAVTPKVTPISRLVTRVTRTAASRLSSQSSTISFDLDDDLDKLELPYHDQSDQDKKFKKKKNQFSKAFSKVINTCSRDVRDGNQDKTRVATEVPKVVNVPEIMPKVTSEPEMVKMGAGSIVITPKALEPQNQIVAVTNTEIVIQDKEIVIHDKEDKLIPDQDKIKPDKVQQIANQGKMIILAPSGQRIMPGGSLSVVTITEPKVVKAPIVVPRSKEQITRSKDEIKRLPEKVEKVLKNPQVLDDQETRRIVSQLGTLRPSSSSKSSNLGSTSGNLIPASANLVSLSKDNNLKVISATPKFDSPIGKLIQELFSKPNCDCTKCGQNFDHPADHLYHEPCYQINHLDNEFKCRLVNCRLSFDNLDKLQQHARQHFGNLIECNLCKNKFKNVESAFEHCYRQHCVQLSKTAN